MNTTSILTDSKIVRDPRTGRPQKIFGDFELPLADNREDSVKSFLVDHSHELELAILASDLRTIKEASASTGAVYRFQQQKDGIPVFGTEILVRLDSAGHIRQINLGFVSPIRMAAPAGDKEMTPQEAIKVAEGAIGEHTLRGKMEKPTRVYFPASEGLKLGYMVMIPTISPPHAWCVIVEAFKGDVLYKKDFICEVDGEGLVFDPNPIVTSGTAALRDPEATVAVCKFAGSTRQTIDNERMTRTLKSLKKSGAKYVLDGDYVKLVDNGVETIAPPQETDPKGFKYSSGSDSFGDVNVYYHVDTIQRYIQSLGITGVMNTQIPADAHHGTGGAYWYPPSYPPITTHGWLAFGQSVSALPEQCKPDRCQDADAILHEYGHAIQHDQVPDWGKWPSANNRWEEDAMGEGFGDILACVYFAPDHPFQQAVFEDWCFADEGGMRRVDGTKVYPTDWHGEVHDDGEIWSAALWNIYLAMGGDNTTDAAVRRAARDQLLKTVILSHDHLSITVTPGTTPVGNSMPDGAEAVMNENAEQRDYCLRYGRQMLDSFHDRGLLQCQVGSDLLIVQLWSQQSKTTPPAGQNVESGQDNWFFARIRNDGNVTARAAVVTFSFKTPFSTPVYPTDFRDHVISGAVLYDLAPGAEADVWALWPKEKIPYVAPNQKLHGCIFAEVYNPVDHVAAGVTSLDWHKLYYHNTDIVNAVSDQTLDYAYTISNYHILLPELVRLEVIRPPRWQNLEVSFHHNDPRVIKGLWEDMARIEVSAMQPVREAVKTRSEVMILEPTQIEVRAAGDQPSLFVNLARGSSLLMQEPLTGEVSTQSMLSEEFVRRGLQLVEKAGQAYLKLLPGIKVGWIYMMMPRTRATLNVRFKVPAQAKPGEQFTFKLVQRNIRGSVIGGFDVLVNVVDRD